MKKIYQLILKLLVTRSIVKMYNNPSPMLDCVVKLRRNRIAETKALQVRQKVIKRRASVCTIPQLQKNVPIARRRLSLGANAQPTVPIVPFDADFVRRLENLMLGRAGEVGGGAAQVEPGKNNFEFIDQNNGILTIFWTNL